MTQTIKKFGLFLILAFTTFFSSCEKDLYEEAIVSSEKSLKIRKVSLNDVSRSENPELFKRIDQLKIKQEKIQARLVYDSINNFYYDDENGKVIEDELGVKSYTFPVYRENSDGKIENVLFSKNKNGEFEVFLVKYSFTDEQLKFLSQYEISQQTAVYTNITANKTVELCIEFWEWISYPINEGDLTGNFGYTGEWILKKKICEDYNEYLDPALGNSTGVDPLNSGSGNSGGIGNAYTTPVPVVITHNEALRRKFFVQQTLTNNQETFFNSLSSDIKNSIFQYLADNSDDLDAYSQDAITFAQEVIGQMMQNPGLNINIEASANSPAFIDTSSVMGNTPEEIKFREVYNNLLQSANFRHFFTSLFGQSPFINVKFVISNISQTSPYGYTAGTCEISSYLNELTSLNTIKIDRQFLLTKSKADIALTILHECIHAFLNVKIRNVTTGITLAQLNNMDFQQCVSTYYSNFSVTQTEHSFMVDYMIPTMVQILQDIKHLIITPIQANALENPTNGGAILYQPLNNPPTMQISDIQVPWNWTDFFTYFSYIGLAQSSSYPFTTPTSNNHIFLNNQDYFRYFYISAYNTICNP